MCYTPWWKSPTEEHDVKYIGSTGTGPVPLSPTGYGLPGTDEDVRFSVMRPWRPLETEWCDEAGCPKRKCVHCKETT